MGPLVIVIIAAAIIYWWFGVREPGRPAPPPAETTESEDVMPAGDSDADIVEPAPTASSEQEDAEDEPVAETDVIETAQPEAAPAVIPEGQVRLSLTFSGDCWTEITDAGGRRLFFGMGRSGRTADLTGRAPVTVLFGNADNVSVRVNGNPYTITTADPGDRTARLTIQSP